ncbi:hypothetical protein PVAND_010020 [Polypedilum vanderplanki]|uniref:Uncharacterized protein n=1 Tax=Polypedilum vanderplanki TaxID=319348 RepID=A0A9J6CEA4_POLVA|nr:hypothetical protein PVAND_010020 [Polypedilum vanderplanki]
MRYPSAVDRNIYLAYIRKENVLTAKRNENHQQKLDAINLNWDLNYPESLVELCIKIIAENWSTLPLFRSIIVPENRSLLADILDFETLQLSELTAHIKVDPLWKRMYEIKWPMISNVKNRPWIELYMEKYLSEFLESLRPVDVVPEKVKNLIELCSPFVNCLTIDRLEVRAATNNDTINDHIPFDIILENLNQLKSISITYDCRTIGTQFYLTCTNISDNDIKKFARGLTQTDLREFKFHSSKLEPQMLKIIGRALDKNTSLVTIEMQNCRFGDAGLISFCSILTHDSLPNVRHLGLSNNFISSEGASLLANILRRRKIETLDLKLNPILSDGANEILALAGIVELTSLNISSCSFDEKVEEALLFVLRKNNKLRKLNISINKLGEDLGMKIYQELAYNQILRELDVRGAGISHKTKRLIDGMVLENREKNNTIHQ